MNWILRARIRVADAERQVAQGMVEYGLILVLVAVVAIAGLIVLGPKISSSFTGFASSV